MNPDTERTDRTPLDTPQKVVTRALEQHIREAERVLAINKGDRDEAQDTVERLNKLIAQREENLSDLKWALHDVTEGLFDY